MNVQQLGTGSTHIGFLVLTASVAAGLSFCLAFGLKVWELAWSIGIRRFAKHVNLASRYINLNSRLRGTIVGEWLMNKLDPSGEEYTI